VPLTDGEVICLLRIFDEQQDERKIDYRLFSQFIFSDHPSARAKIRRRLSKLIGDSSPPSSTSKKITTTTKKKNKKKSSSKKRYQQPTKSWNSVKAEEDFIAKTPSAFRSALRNQNLSLGQRLAFTPRTTTASKLARSSASLQTSGRRKSTRFASTPSSTTKGYMRPTKNWIRDHESPFHPQSFASSTKHFLGTFRRAHLTEGQKFAFGAHANISATRTPRKLSRKKLNEIRNKLRAHAYVDTKGFNLHEEFKRFEKECRGHGDISGMLSYEEFKHAVKRLCPVSEGDFICLLRMFDKSRTGYIKYSNFLRFFQERFDEVEDEKQAENSEMIKELPLSTRKLLDVASSLGITEKTLQLLHLANGFDEDDDDDDKEKQPTKHYSIHVKQEDKEENTIEDLKRLLRVASQSIDLAEKQLSGMKVKTHFLREGKQAISQAQIKLDDLDADIKVLLEAQAIDDEDDFQEN